ncbi:MAG: cyclic nucleotide-binding domain-containing protein [Anaerolineales bacterium]|nr:cyclic nucleotide-binding domain-containing protein [Anaerolineales bacterium]
MDPLDLLLNVELFEGLKPEELEMIAAICERRRCESGEFITRQGEPGEELFIVDQGFVEITHLNPQPASTPRAVVNLGKGQIFGEMALVDMGPRSASVRAISDDTQLFVIKRAAFRKLCESNHHLGYIVMQNIAADLSFKLRHRHLVSR